MHFIGTLNSLARSRGLEFLVIGAHAVFHHGCPRESADLDLLVRKNARGEWLDLLASLGYRVFQEREVFLQLNASEREAWPVDLMLVNDETFAKMREAAVEVEFADAKGLIPCVEHLIALKLHALKHGRIHRFLKDFQDVEGIVRKNELDLKSESIRQLFLKHGTMDLYEKFVHACSDR
ncbi:MAG: hypothetical protein HY735_12390 [Verrucomicrobia bacterium]|nr:hypothetical protein [Verrucomicrobiota bacterium]